jgi:hypothetical protein
VILSSTSTHAPLFLASTQTVNLLLPPSLSWMVVLIYAWQGTSPTLLALLTYCPCQSQWPSRGKRSHTTNVAQNGATPPFHSRTGAYTGNYVSFAQTWWKQSSCHRQFWLKGNIFTSWTQTAGYKDDRPGSIRFDSSDGSLAMFLHLECHDGLYYCVSNVYTIDSDTLEYASH